MLRQANILIFMGILALSLNTAFAAGVYKWVGADGTVHYGQDKPKGAKAEELTIKVPKTSAATQARAKPSAAAAADDATKTPAEQQRAEVHSKNCEISKANLKTLQDGGLRLVTSNPDGSTKHWSEEERQAKIAEARKQVSYYCDGTGKDDTGK